MLCHRCSFPANIPKRPAVLPPIKEKQTGHFNFVNLTCEQHDRAKSPTSPAVSWRLLVCVKEILHARGGNFARIFVSVCKNVLEWQGVCETKILKMCASPQIAQKEREVEGARGGRRSWGEAAGAVRSPVRSAGETQFTLPCRHPG